MGKIPHSANASRTPGSPPAPRNRLTCPWPVGVGLPITAVFRRSR